MELAESVLCYIYSCFAHGDALQPERKTKQIFPTPRVSTPAPAFLA